VTVLFTFFSFNCCPCVLIASGKSGVCGDEKCKTEMKRNVLSLPEKLEVLNKFQRGMSVAAMGRHYSVNKSMGAKFMCVNHCDTFLEKVNGSLCVWLEDGTEERLSALLW
jgi:hypothetical protein